MTDPLPPIAISIEQVEEVAFLDLCQLAARLYPHVELHPPETRAGIAVTEALSIMDVVREKANEKYADLQG